MNKEFIPYTQSLELKELGFEEPCFAITNGDKLFYGEFKSTHEYYKESGQILYQQAFRWFREKYQDDFYINKWIDDKYWYHIPFLFGSIKERREYRESFSTYEEAELACIDKLIQIVKQKQL